MKADIHILRRLNIAGNALYKANRAEDTNEVSS